MDEDTAWALAATVIIVALAAMICVIVGVSTHNTTQRQLDCVSHGGSYVKAQNSAKMECTH